MSSIVQIKDGQPNWGPVFVCESLGFIRWLLSYSAAFLVITKFVQLLQIPVPLWTDLAKRLQLQVLHMCRQTNQRMQSGGRQTPVKLMVAWLQRPAGMHAMMALQ